MRGEYSDCDPYCPLSPCLIDLRRLPLCLSSLSLPHWAFLIRTLISLVLQKYLCHRVRLHCCSPCRETRRFCLVISVRKRLMMTKAGASFPQGC